MKNVLDISDILVTQSNLRNKSQLSEMIDFAGAGGSFNELTLASYAIRKSSDRVSPIIEIAKFEDGTLAIHNGHHRAVSIYLGRDSRKLHSDEFFVREWKFSDYSDIVLPNWITPFDVLKEFRHYDLSSWKNKVREFYKMHGEKNTIDFIKQNKIEYCYDRYFFTVGDMVSKLELFKYKD